MTVALKQNVLFEDIYIHPKTIKLLNLDEYDKILLATSGGKDSLAMILHLIDQGILREKLEIIHNSIDGRGDTYEELMDRPSTEGYVRQLAKHLGINLQWQWRAYGFHGELYKENAMSHDILYQNDEESIVYRLPTTMASISTRRRWPAKTASLRTRWCSDIGKISVTRKVLNNREDLKGTVEDPRKILMITGERREESPARSRYAETELHSCSSKSRLVHHWRPVIDWKERDVWSIIEKHRIVPHPAYTWFPRLSCRSCIFFLPDHWSTLSELDPKVVKRLRDIEIELAFTIDNKYNLDELVKMGRTRVTDENRIHIKKVVQEWTDSVITDNWQLPEGAFSGLGGGSL